MISSAPLPMLAPAQPVLCAAHEPGFVLGKLSHQGVSDGHEGYPGFIRDPSQADLSAPWPWQALGGALVPRSPVLWSRRQGVFWLVTSIRCREITTDSATRELSARQRSMSWGANAAPWAVGWDRPLGLGAGPRLHQPPVDRNGARLAVKPNTRRGRRAGPGGGTGAPGEMRPGAVFLTSAVPVPLCRGCRGSHRRRCNRRTRGILEN